MSCAVGTSDHHPVTGHSLRQKFQNRNMECENFISNKKCKKIKLSVLGFSDTKWMETGILNQDGMKFVYSGGGQET